MPWIYHLSLKWAPLKWDLALIKRKGSLIHKFSVPTHSHSTSSRLNSNCFLKILTYICFHANHRTAKVALIQTLFGQQGLDMSYFRHDYHYDHLLSIIKIYNTEEMCCYVQPASAIIKKHKWLKRWPSWGTTPSGHILRRVHRHCDLSLNIRCVAIENRV